MKLLEELTEKEIYQLKDNDINDYIKLKKAKEGIKLIEKPEHPKYRPIKEKDITVFCCGLFGGRIVFSDINELKEAIDLYSSAKTKYRLDSNYIDSAKYLIEKHETDYYFKSWDEIRSVTVYSPKLYAEVRIDLEFNKSLKESYNKLIDEYNKEKDNSDWIESEIYEKVNSVRQKFWKLEDYCNKMKNDYMSIAENDETIAINFLVKAYSLNNEEKEYVLNNYK